MILLLKVFWGVVEQYFRGGRVFVLYSVQHGGQEAGQQPQNTLATRLKSGEHGRSYAQTT